MRLNDMSPDAGSRRKRKRVGRGTGSGIGKTAGRGVKGQKSRSGGFTKVGFEGGQMPLQRRVPKIGFTSRKSLVTSELRLDVLNKLEDGDVDLAALKTAGLVTKNTKFAKVFLAGEISKKVNLKGIRASAGARKAIEAAGGSVEA